jgi:hypothetical protein
MLEGGKDKQRWKVVGIAVTYSEQFPLFYQAVLRKFVSLK